MTAQLYNTVKVLLVEDSDEDAFILAHALERFGPKYVLNHVQDGEEAMAYLRREPRPDIMLLDIKMPRFDGFDVLAYLRAERGAHPLPVIVLSGSDLADDKEHALVLGATDYVVKDPDYNALALNLDRRISQILRS